jgi:hypothetical protein
MDYHIMTKELYPHGNLLETRGFFANDKSVRVCPPAAPDQCVRASLGKPQDMQWLRLALLRAERLAAGLGARQLPCGP